MGCLADDAPKTKEPKDSALAQQRLPAVKVVISSPWVIATYMALTAVMLAFGIPCTIDGIKPCEVKQRYDESCLSNLPSNTARNNYITNLTVAENDALLSCSVTLKVDCDMKGPVFVWYQIYGMYQSHRRYVKSLSDIQLADLEGNQYLTYCAPQRYQGNNHSKPISPCGLQAWSYFNDTYTMSLSRGSTVEPLPISSQGIAIRSDKEYRYGDQSAENFNTDPLHRGGASIAGPVNEDERFLVWMRIPATPDFRKLWGKIHANLKKGDTITVDIINRYNTYAFDGRKHIVIGTTNWMGSYNPFMGIAFLVTAGISFIFGILYAVAWMVTRTSHAPTPAHRNVLSPKQAVMPAID